MKTSLFEMFYKEEENVSKEDKRRLIKVLSGAFGLTIAATGLIFLWMGRAGIMDLMAEKKTAYSALEVGLEDLHAGDHVTVDASVAVDYVLQRTKTGTTNGYVTSQVTWRYYLIPVIKSDEQRIYMDHMVLVSRKGNFNKIDEASKALMKWWDSEDISMETFPSETVLSIDGRVAKLTAKELKLLKEYFGDTDYRKIVAPYVIKPLWDEGSKDIMIDSFYIGVGSVVAGLALLFFAFFFGRKKGTKKNAAAGIAGQETQEPQSTGQTNRIRERLGTTTFVDLRNDPAEFKKYMDGKVKELSAEQKTEVLDLIGSGQTIAAIKVFREMTGVGLAYAKEAVDHYDVYIK